MSDTQTEAPAQHSDGAEEQQARTFTQADMDDLAKKIRAEERRKASERFADYDDLKAKAGTAKTVEERMAQLEQELAKERATALRASVAARFGVSTEPDAESGLSDADLFLTGADEETLTAQAKRLAGRESERQRSGNIAPLEGTTPNTTEDEARAAARALFSSD